MKFGRKLSVDPVLVLVVAMCVLLPGLAMLQFSWIGDVQKADEARMRSVLQRSSDHLAEEFNGELMRFYRSVLAPSPLLTPATPAPSAPRATRPSTLALDNYEDQCMRFRRWHNTALQPHLIRAIYVITADEKLHVCDVDTGKLVAAEWPDDLKATAKLWMPKPENANALAQSGHTAVGFKDYVPLLPAPWRPFRMAFNGPNGGVPNPWRMFAPGGGPRRFGFDEFRGEHERREGERPRMERPEREARERGFDPGLRRRFFAPPDTGAGNAMPGLALAVPDMNWIQTQWLPELVTKHFGHPSTSEAVVRIEITVPHLKVYESGAWSAGAADVSAALWRAPGWNAAWGLAAGAMGIEPGPEAGRMATPPLSTDANAEERHRAAQRGPGGPAYWTLLARLKAGPVAAVAAQTRFRNLSVGGGILLLLAATMSLLIVTLRRQRRLARQQMEFVAGVSHELRTPVAVMSSAGENLADGIVTSPASVREYGAMIRDEARRLATMIEQTLRFAGIQGGRSHYNRQPVDVAQAVDAALRNHDALVRNSGCTVERNLDEALPHVVADPTALSHCIGNLISNAARYAASGQWIGIRATRVTTANGTGEQVAIEVADHGDGIDAKDLPHLFEPFYRGRQIRDRQIQGTGLGLALVKRIMEDLGGAVTVQSTRQKGSCFTLTLPVAVTEQRPTGEPR